MIKLTRIEQGQANTRCSCPIRRCYLGALTNATVGLLNLIGSGEQQRSGAIISCSRKAMRGELCSLLEWERPRHRRRVNGQGHCFEPAGPYDLVLTACRSSWASETICFCDCPIHQSRAGKDSYSKGWWVCQDYGRSRAFTMPWWYWPVEIFNSDLKTITELWLEEYYRSNPVRAEHYPLP